MPSLSAVQQYNNSVSSSAKTPVGVFVGGTSGIGRGMARAFARHHKGNARLIIIVSSKSHNEARCLTETAFIETLLSTRTKTNNS